MQRLAPFMIVMHGVLSISKYVTMFRGGKTIFSMLKDPTEIGWNNLTLYTPEMDIARA